MLHLPGSCFEIDWLIRPSFREGFDLQDMFDPYKILSIFQKLLCLHFFRHPVSESKSKD
jgi:hypothetical protein